MTRLVHLVLASLFSSLAPCALAEQTQRWFTYKDRGFLGHETPVQLEILATEPEHWNGQVVVINHGSTGRGHGSNGYDDSRIKSPVRFSKIVTALTGMGYRTFVLMRKGRGHSEGRFTEEDAHTCALSDQMRGVDEAEPQLDQFVDWVRHEYSLERVIVMGHSRGGFLSSYYSARHPEKVAFAINISGGWTTQCEAKNGMTYQMLQDSSTRFKRQTWVYASKDTYFTDDQLAGYQALADAQHIRFILLETTAGDGHAFASANPSQWMNMIPDLQSKSAH